MTTVRKNKGNRARTWGRKKKKTSGSNFSSSSTLANLTVNAKLGRGMVRVYEGNTGVCRGRRMEANPRTRTLDSRLAAIKRFSTPRRTLYRAPTNHLYPSLGTGQHVCRRSWAPRNQIPGSLTLVFEGGPRRPPAAGKLTRVERKSKLSSFILFLHLYQSHT